MAAPPVPPTERQWFFYSPVFSNERTAVAPIGGTKVTPMMVSGGEGGKDAYVVAGEADNSFTGGV